MKRTTGIMAMLLVLTMLVGIAPAAFASSGEFNDVSSDAWYYEAVSWAVEKGVTSGVGGGLFAPDATCTRAQVVTFLWRAMGEPEPGEGTNPFADVKEVDYFYKAVLWAVENGITAGVSPTQFGPDQSCTRAQVVTFLWRTMGEPEPEDGANIFGDIPGDSYFYKAVLWAVEKGITSGMGDGIFAPDNACTRGQIVCFLHRTPGVGPGSAPKPDPKPDPDPEPDPEPEPEPLPPAEPVWMISNMLFTGGKTGGNMGLILDLRYEYDSAGRLTRVYTTGGQVDMKCGYDDRGNLSTVYYKVPGEEMNYEWRYNSDDEPIAYYENGRFVEGYYYLLDAEGRVLEEEYLDDATGVTLYRYTYDEEGRLLTKHEELYDRHSISDYTYSYDDQGRLKQETRTPYANPTVCMDYEYADDGSITIIETGINNAGTETVARRRTHIYTDEAGRYVEEVRNLEENYREKLNTKTFNEKGLLINEKDVSTRIIENYEMGRVVVDEGVIMEYTYEYDADGRLVFSKEERHESYLQPDGTIELEYCETDEEYRSYDAKGRIISIAEKGFIPYVKSDGSQYVIQDGAHEMSYEYDDQDRLVKSIENRYSFGHYGGDEPELKLFTVTERTYKYDEKGRLIKDLTVENDGEGNGVSYINNYVVYDAQDRMTGQQYYSEGNNRCDIINYQYDDAGNIVYEAYTVSVGGQVESYEIKNTYNYKNQLTKMVYTDNAGNTVTENYSYDHYGNLTYYTTTQNSERSTTTVKYNSEGLPIRSETKSSTQGTTIICEMSYVQVPKVEMDGFVEMLISQIEALL